MQSGQQFKIDQPGLMKAGLIPVIVGAVGGLLWISASLWGIAGLIGWLAPIFGGVWYVMTFRKTNNTMPAQMDGLVNGAILGAVAGLAYGLVAFIAGQISGLGGFASLAGAGIGNAIVDIIIGAVLGAVGAFGYAFLVAQGTIK